MEASSHKDFTDEDFMDFLEAHDVKSVVSRNNWQKVLHEIAHKELIQEPAYVSECWRRILPRHLQVPCGGIGELITSLIPKPKRVIACLAFQEDI